MATTFKYKDTSGNIQTINIDPTYANVLSVPTTTTEISIIITDPVSSNTYDFVGSQKKR